MSCGNSISTEVSMPSVQVAKRDNSEDPFQRKQAPANHKKTCSHVPLRKCAVICQMLIPFK